MISPSGLKARLDWYGCATFRLTVGSLVIFLDAYIDRVPVTNICDNEQLSQTKRTRQQFTTKFLASSVDVG